MNYDRLFSIHPFNWHAIGTVMLAVVVVTVLLGVDLLEDYFGSMTKGVHRKYQDWKGKRW